MYWSRGAWRIGEMDQLETDQVQCMAFFESDASHPTAKPGVVWKGVTNGRASGKDDHDFEFVAGVNMATGPVSVPCWDFSRRYSRE